METAWTCLIAGGLAGLITLLELDRTFYVPKKTSEWLKLQAWWWGFIVCNAVLAAGLFLIVGDLEAFAKQIESRPLRAVLIGLGYLALIRLKIATVNIQDSQQSVGLEALYEGLKGFFYKRINGIVRKARHEETTELAKSSSLTDLLQRARNDLKLNDLLPSDKKKALLDWIHRIEKDPISTEDDKKFSLANFILSDRADGVENP